MELHNATFPYDVVERQRSTFDHIKYKGAVLVDLDGTLAQCEDRLHFIKAGSGLMKPREERNWDAFHRAGCSAPPEPKIVELVQMLHAGGYYIHIVTGRPVTYTLPTQFWMFQHNIPFHEITMRGEQDYRSDVEYKGEVFSKYAPCMVYCILEDRDGVTHMARVSGFTVLQVANGAF